MKIVTNSIKKCAIYTRKSTDEGLAMEFNSLDAQYEACTSYVESQRSEGWVLSPDRYDDGGFSGGTLERPALQRLLKDIEAGRIGVVVVYKIDRLSRSLMDFTKLVEIFDQSNASFVSITQSFSTTNSMGRLTLNILLSFAQFEREIAAERVRDKICASRKKGMWMGGTPPLGYDVKDRKLLVNTEESTLVRHIFQRFLEIGSSTLLVKELNEQGYHTKAWTTINGRVHEGNEFNKGGLYKLINNRLYLGEAVYKGTSYPGEHDGIVDRLTFDRVQSILAENNRKRANRTRAQTPALLKGFIFCRHCRRAMTPTHAKNNTGKQYRYYLCMNAAKKSHADCPLPNIPAGEIEELVFDHIRAVIKTPELVARIWKMANEDENNITEQAITAALQRIDPVWDQLFPGEKTRIIQLLVARVDVDQDGVAVQLRVVGLHGLVRELTDFEIEEATA